jgi:hypothetical protein
MVEYTNRDPEFLKTLMTGDKLETEMQLPQWK